MGSPSPQYGLPFDRNSLRFKVFCAKKWFTLKEFACLLAGVDPTSFDNSFASKEVFRVKAGTYLRLLKEEERETEVAEIDSDEVCYRPGGSFCGFEDTATHEYPVKAFHKFCNSRRIPFPLEEQRTLTYTIGEAVAEILSITNPTWNVIKHGYRFTPKDDDGAGVAAKLQEWFEGQVKQCRNLECPCYVLAGYISPNPLNALSVDRAEFPKEAYYRLWLAHPVGLSCPLWFTDLSSDTLPAAPVLPDVVAKELGLDGGAQSVVTPAAEIASNKAIPAPVTDGAEMIADGVTVNDVRALFDEGGKRYRAPLAEAVRLWASFEHDKRINCVSVKQECEDRFKERRCPDGKESSARWSTNESKAILNLVNWDRTGNNKNL